MRKGSAFLWIPLKFPYRSHLSSSHHPFPFPNIILHCSCLGRSGTRESTHYYRRSRVLHNRAGLLAGERVFNFGLLGTHRRAAFPLKQTNQ